MQNSRFDELTKALATSPSRRQALKTFAATALAGMLGLSGVDKVFADDCIPSGDPCPQPPPPHKKTKGRKRGCCSGICDPLTNTCV